MNILIVAAHPDDEILGVGGTIAKHIEAGDAVYALILGEGQTSRFEKREDAGTEILERLHEDTMRSAAVLGIRDVYFENFADNRFDSVALLEIVKAVERRIRELAPEIVYTHHRGDLNIDHQITYQAVMTATRPMADQPVKEIYAFETVSSTEWNFTYGDEQFAPDVFVRLTDEQFEKKLSAMRKYETELCEFPHPRSLEMLRASASRWGGVVGARYAEAFETVRVIR
ncbi:MAG: PIG-L family deacetylase [Lachnospiraceae bacterium]|nr:PIG-L family deacetylase [Lachnospiraceae bacterium]